MKSHKSIYSLVIFSVVSTLLFFNCTPVKAAEKASAANAPVTQSAPAGPAEGQAGFQKTLAGSYVIDFLEPENAPDKTVTIHNPEGANISATWVDPDHGYQELTNVSFDGEILTFNALSGTPGDEYFYFHLNLYGSCLVGYAKTQDMSKSPVVGTPVK